MSTISFKDIEMSTHGELPAVGEHIQEVLLTKNDLSTVNLAEYRGSRLLINVYPSIDTQVCFQSVLDFSSQLEATNTQLLCVSMDLPFALKRIAEGTAALRHIHFLSDFRNRSFGHLFGLTIADGPLAGLLARAVILVDEDQRVVYRELVQDISQVPNYAEAMAHIEA